MKYKSSSTMIKAINYNSIWDILLREKELTIPNIIEMSGLSLPTVTRAVEFGISIGMLKNDKVAQSNGGRKAQLYELNKDYSHFLLILHGKSELNFQIKNLYSEEVYSGKKATSYSNILTDIDEIIESSIKKNPNIKFVAISLNCIVNNGCIVDWWANPEAKGYKIKEIIEKKFNVRVVVENDMKVAVSASQNYIDDYQNKYIASVQFGNNGFGAGFMIDGKVIRGKSGFAGELGYLPIALKYEYSINFCSRVVRAIVSMNDPDVIIIYFTTQKGGLEKVTKSVKSHVPSYAVPKIIEGKSFKTDTFFGLQFLCIQEQKHLIDKMF